MDVRRQARLTAAAVPSPGAIPGLIATTPIPQGQALNPAALYGHTFAALPPPQIPHIPHTSDVGFLGQAPVRRIEPQERAPVQRRNDARYMSQTLGVSDAPIRKDRRKDRHKRASDGRNPMIRLNPSTADRFFAVQRLLESKRFKKTSGSFVINWLIDVAHASIQAVLEQGASEAGQDQRADPGGQGLTSEEAADGGVGDRPSGGERAPDRGDIAVALGISEPKPPSLHISHDDLPTLSLDHLRPHHGREYFDPGTRAPFQAQAAVGIGPCAAGHRGLRHEHGGVEEEELLVEVGGPQTGGLAAGETLPHEGFLPKPQVRFTAAEIARSAMAAAEAAEADDEDEEVDIVADGDTDLDGSTALRAFGHGNPDMWMRSGRPFSLYQENGAA